MADITLYIQKPEHIGCTDAVVGSEVYIYLNPDSFTPSAITTYSPVTVEITEIRDRNPGEPKASVVYETTTVTDLPPGIINLTDCDIERVQCITCCEQLGDQVLPPGGNDGEILVKQSDDDYDVAWEPLPDPPADPEAISISIPDLGMGEIRFSASSLNLPTGGFTEILITGPLGNIVFNGEITVVAGSITAINGSSASNPAPFGWSAIVGDSGGELIITFSNNTGDTQTYHAKPSHWIPST